MPCLALVSSRGRVVGFGVTLSAVMTLVLPSVVAMPELCAIPFLTVTIGPFRDPVSCVTLSGIPLQGARLLTDFLLATMILVYVYVLCVRSILSINLTLGCTAVPNRFSTLLLALFVVFVFGPLATP